MSTARLPLLFGNRPGGHVRLAMLVCFALMGIYWVRFAQIGAFSIEAYHVGVLLLVGATCASMYGAPAAIRVLACCAPWLLAYVAYLVLLLAAVSGTPGLSIWLKQLLFVTGFVCVASYFSRASKPEASLRRGGLWGIILFIAVTEYSARQIDKSLVTATTDFLASGNFQALIFNFFRPVFNSLEHGTELVFRASLTNSIAVSLLVLSICYRAGFRKSGIDFYGTSSFLLALFLCILLNSRSVVLAGVASLGLALLIRMAIVRAVSLTALLWCCVLTIALSILALVTAIHGASFLEAVLKAFQFSDKSTESRLFQYRWALDLIEKRLLLGHGYVETDGGHPIHNLFLSAWAYTGYTGFGLIVTFYIGLLYAWTRWLYLALTRPSFWVLRARLEWVAVLPVLPLFRVWVSGGGGHVAFGEWIALGVFFGLLMQNEMNKRQTTGLRDLKMGQTRLALWHR